MEKQALTRIILGVAFMLASACGSSSGDSPGDGTEADSRGATVTAELEVFEFTAAGPFVELAGARVCVYGGSDCSTSDARGRVTLELPARAETGITIEKEGYVPGLMPFLTGEEDFAAQTLTTSEPLIVTLATVLETEWPMNGTGAVNIGTIGADPFVFGEDGIEGITFAGPSDVGRAYYFDGAIPSTELDATTNSLGSGGYLEMPPGDYDVTLGGTASNCRPYGAWEGDTPNAIAFPVVAGYITYALVMCDPAP